MLKSERTNDRHFRERGPAARRMALLAALAASLAGAGVGHAQAYAGEASARAAAPTTQSAKKASTAKKSTRKKASAAKKSSRGTARRARSTRASTASRALGKFAALKGSRPKVQGTFYNTVARGVAFYDGMDEARAAIAAGKFVPLYGNAYYATYHMTLAYATPAAKQFVEVLAPQFVEHCDEMMVVTSALRPKSRSPRNGSPWTVHPTGIAVDIRKPRNTACWSWLRQALLEYQEQGYVDATEEFHPPHFHIAVKKAPPPLNRTVEVSNGEVIAVVR